MTTASVYKLQQDVAWLRGRVEDHEAYVPQLQREMAEATKRIAQLELTVQALIGLHVQAGVTREELEPIS